jgi:CRISPR system Cascade subunit CasD
MRHLALYLRAPLQSWGASSKFGDRGTIDAPTRSGLLGMIAAACGIDKNDEVRDSEWLARAEKLSLTILAFRRGDRMTDYHTVGARYDKDDPWQRRMIPTKAEDGKPKNYATETRRDYLMDSVFGVVISGDDKIVAEMAEGLADPVWGVWFGRKSCIPTEPILVGVFDSDEAARKALDARLRASLERGGGRIAGKREDEAVKFDLVEAAVGDAEETLIDVPVSFKNREFHARRVRREIHEPIAKG